MAAVIFTVPGLSCDHCERTVRAALARIPGVERVAVDLGAKRVSVTYDDGLVTVGRLRDVLRDEEYPVSSVATL